MIVGITMQPQPSSAAHEEQHLKHHHTEEPPQRANVVEEQPVLHLPEETGYMTSHDSPAAAYAHQQPPSQVYVDNMGQHSGAMMGEMEQQFQQFGLHTIENIGGENHSAAAAGDSSENNTEHNGSEEAEEDPVKLFVGQVRQRNERLSLACSEHMMSLPWRIYP